MFRRVLGKCRSRNFCYFWVRIFTDPSFSQEAIVVLLKIVRFLSLHLQEEVAKNLLAEFNLGCDVHQTEHVYRVYVATFLGFGGNAARQRYEDQIFANTVLKNR